MNELRTLVYNVDMNVDGAESGAKKVKLTMQTMESDTASANKTMGALANTIGQKVNVQTKVMSDDLATAAAALRSQTKEVSRSNNAYSQLSREYTHLSSRLGKTADEQEILNAQHRLGKSATDEQRKAVERLVKTYQLQRNALNKSQPSMRGFRGQMQNIGYQAQDIAVQMQMGTDKMVIFAQQGSQLAAGFGPKGALIGAGIALAGMFGSVLLPQIFKTGEAVENLSEKLEKMAKTTGLTKEGAQVLIDEKLKLIKEIEKSAESLEKEIIAFEKGKETYEQYAERGRQAAIAQSAMVNGKVKLVKSEEDWTSAQIKANKANEKNIASLQVMASDITTMRGEITKLESAIGKPIDQQKKWEDSNEDLVKSLAQKAKQVAFSSVKLLEMARAEDLASMVQKEALPWQIRSVKASYDRIIADAKVTEGLKEQAKEQAKISRMNSIANRVGNTDGQLKALKERYKTERELFKDNKSMLESLEEEYQENRIEIAGTSIEKYMASLEKSLNDFDQLTQDGVKNFSESFGQGFSDALQNWENLGQFGKDIFDTIKSSMISFFGEWIAQQTTLFLLEQYQKRITQGQNATVGTANATAKVTEAGLNAFAATAAIPLVGPAAAPAAATAAIGIATPMAAAVSNTLFAGMFDKGGIIPEGMLGIVSEYQDELVNGVLVRGNAGGTRVTSSKETNNIMNRNSSSGDTIVNVMGRSSTPEEIAGSLVRLLRRGSNKELDKQISRSVIRGNKNA